MGFKWEGLKPAATMVAVQTAFAGVNVFYKLAVNDEMNIRVLVAYRVLFAAAFLCPLAYFWERKIRPRLTWKILLHSFLCGLFGLTIAQNFYITSLKLTSATFVSAMSNLSPGITYILAVSFKLERLAIHKAYGWAKLIGTLVGIGGAMLLTFYKGSRINLWSTNVNLLKHQHNSSHVGPPLPSHQDSRNHIMGSLTALGSCLSYSIWLIIQAKIIKAYPCNYSSAALMTLMASIQSIAFALCMERNWPEWRLGFNIRLLSSVYSGVVGSALTLILMSWCIKKKGPLYVSVFNPLMLVIVAVLCSLLFDEELRAGSVIGAALIVVGLYITLWGKRREARTAAVSGINDATSVGLRDGSDHMKNKEYKEETDHDLENPPEK